MSAGAASPGPGAFDLHAHLVPAALADALRARHAVPRIARADDGGERLLMPIGTLAFSAHYVEPARRLALMDECGIAHQLLSLPGLFGIDSLPAQEAAPLLRSFNDDCAALCREFPRRFSGLAALPLDDMAAAVAELWRAREQGLLGAILPADAFASVARARALRPLFEAGDALGAHFFVHPGRIPAGGALPPPPPDHELARRALAVQAELGEAMVTLLLSDFLDAFPNVSVQMANLGGTFAAVVERMDHMTRLRTPGAALPSSRARRVWVDCASLGAGALEQALRVFGADRVLLGTDSPIFDAAHTLAEVARASLGADERERVLHGNARALLERLR